MAGATLLSVRGAATYQLLTEDGDELGPLVSPHRDWRPGLTFTRGGRRFEVVSVVRAEDGDGVHGYIVAREAAA